MGNASGKQLPYKVGAPVEGLRYASSSIWTLSEGTPTAEPSTIQAPGQALHSNVLIFRLEKKGAAASDIALAQNTLKRLKMLRHPYVLRLLVCKLPTAAPLCPLRFQHVCCTTATHRPPCAGWW